MNDEIDTTLQRACAVPLTEPKKDKEWDNAIIQRTAYNGDRYSRYKRIVLCYIALCIADFGIDNNSYWTTSLLQAPGIK